MENKKFFLHLLYWFFTFYKLINILLVRERVYSLEQKFFPYISGGIIVKWFNLLKVYWADLLEEGYLEL